MNDTEQRVIIAKDGEPKAIVDTIDDGFMWILDHCPYSFQHATAYEGWTVAVADRWDDGDKHHHHSTAWNIMYGDSYHNKSTCKTNGQLGRTNCAGCCLRGYQPRGGWEPGANTRVDGPNYAGWARIYVESRTAIPEKWRAAFRLERKTDNLRYAAALERSIATFGVTFA